MVSKRPYLFPGVIFFLVLVFLSGGMVNADPLPLGDPRIKDDTTIPPGDLPNASAVKNPHGFLQFDGTGYRVVTRDVKPEKANCIRLRPVAPPKGSVAGSTVYTLEVLDGKTAEAGRQPAGSTEEKPHFAFERVEDLDKKGVTPEPKKEHKADVGVGVKVSESSELMVGRNLVLERNDNRLESRDDGWRFRFKTNF